MRGLLALGAAVSCLDDSVGELQAFGELQDLVADPLRKEVTCLVVEPQQFSGGARLVSLDLVREIESDTAISLDCSLTTARALPEVQEVSHHRLGEPAIESPQWDVGVRDVMAMPFYDAGAMIAYSPAADPEVLMIYDRIPKGQVEIRRTSLVSTSDGGEVGRVTGLFIDRGEITHVAIERKHLGRRRALAISVTHVLELATDNVTLRLTHDQLGMLHWRQVPARRRR